MVHQQRAGVDEVERARRQTVCLASPVSTPDVDEPLGCQLLPGSRDMSRVSVDLRRSARRSGRAGVPGRALERQVSLAGCAAR
jgi:hypothetical protein